MYFLKYQFLFEDNRMKKVIIYFLILVASQVYAAPCGNPLNPEIIEEGFFISPCRWANFRIGYEGVFVADARMEKRFDKGKIDNFKFDINSGTFTLNLQNRVDLFGVFGASRIRSDWRFENSNAMSRIELETNYKFYWAAGGKIILFQWGNTGLSCGGRYSFTDPSLSFITLDGSPRNVELTKIKYRDWQIDLGIGHKIDIFIPYIGVKYLNAKAFVFNSPIVIESNGLNYILLKNKDKFGVYAGCTLSNCKYFLLTVEARFIDEEAISVVGEMRF